LAKEDQEADEEHDGVHVDLKSVVDRVEPVLVLGVVKDLLSVVHRVEAGHDKPTIKPDVEQISRPSKHSQQGDC
jgi:hypothetical protein